VSAFNREGLDLACRLGNQAIDCPALPVDDEQRQVARELAAGKDPVGEWESTVADALVAGGGR